MKPLLPALAVLLLAPLPALADSAEPASRAAPVRVAMTGVADKAATPGPLPVARSERPRTCSDMRCPSFIVLGTAY